MRANTETGEETEAPRTPGQPRVLVAEDTATLRHVLVTALADWGLEALAVEDGASAWEQLRDAREPTLALIDWLMPEIDGIDLCRRLRALPDAAPTYVILVTSKGRSADIVEGLDAGADDYIRKPFDESELEARVKVGLRTLDLQVRLADRVEELERALERVRMLQGILPICAYCRRVRDDQNYWRQVEDYVASHLDARVSHGVCPSCFEIRRAELEEEGGAGA